MWQWLTGKSKSAEKVIDGLYSGIDKSILTDEEKLDFNQKQVGNYLEHQRITANENTQRSLARRHIAVLIMVTGLLSFLVSAFLGFWIEGFSDHINQTAKTFGIKEMMLTVTIFFFGNHLIGRFSERRKD